MEQTNEQGTGAAIMGRRIELECRGKCPEKVNNVVYFAVFRFRQRAVLYFLNLVSSLAKFVYGDL